MSFEQLIAGANALVQQWYAFGVFAGLLIAGLGVFWIFYDAARRAVDATWWKALSVVAAILVLPSLVFRLAPSVASGSLSSAVVPIAYLGLAATALALVAVALFAAGVGTAPANVCPNCGQRLDPSWDRCPYCQPEVAPAPEPGPVTEPTVPVSPPVLEPRSVHPAQETQLLQKPPLQLAFLVFTSGVRRGKQCTLGENTSIGRDPSLSEIVIDDDDTVSRQHAKIKLEGKRFTIFDLGSANHTYVNEKEVYHQVLSDGDRIRLGKTTFAFITLKEKGAEKEKRKPSKRAPKKATPERSG